MEISSMVYISDDCLKKSKKIIKKLRSNKNYLRGVYIITAPLNANDQLDIYSYNLLFLKFIKVYDKLPVVGIANNKDDACELVAKICDDCLKKTGELDLRDYFGLYVEKETGGEAL